MYKYDRPKQYSECVGSLRSAMLEKLRPAPLLGTEAKVSLTGGLCLWRKAVWAHLNATRQGHAARSPQLAALSRAAVQASPLSPCIPILRTSTFTTTHVVSQHTHTPHE